MILPLVLTPGQQYGNENSEEHFGYRSNCGVYHPPTRHWHFDEEINGTPRIKDGYNPATWMLEVTSAAQEEGLGVNFTNIYKNSELYRRNKALVKELSSPAPGSKDLCFQTRYSQSFLTQYGTIGFAPYPGPCMD
ncbi:hypothetical protein DITRI_Ditri07aG0028200 [Diplodiscus trichospermus]